MFPYSYWALTCRAALPSYSAFMISVRQASDLPPASFRFPVTWDTLALGYILPAVGRIRDFHPLKHAPAGRTSATPIPVPHWDGRAPLSAGSACIRRWRSYKTKTLHGGCHGARLLHRCFCYSRMLCLSGRLPRFAREPCLCIRIIDWALSLSPASMASRRSKCCWVEIRYHSSGIWFA